MQAHAPIVWTKWNLQLCEEIINSGEETNFPSLYMAQNQIVPQVSSFTCALAGDVTYGQQTTPLLFGRVCRSQTKFALSDVQLAFGWDFLSSPEGHLGINLRTAIPTGSRPTGQYLFEPIVGNGKHWELGVGFNGRTLIWERDGGMQDLSIWAVVNAVHLFNARQRRSFDLCNGFASRYVLTKEFNTSEQYINSFEPTINKTTLWCDVSVNIQLDIVFMAAYRYHCWNFDVGYNGWIRSREQISLLDCIDNRRFGLKGIQDVAFIGNVASDATQSTATIEGNPFMDQGLVIDPDSPVFYGTCDLNLRSGASPLVITHKVFGHVSREWRRYKRNIIPFLGIGGEIEFEGINENACPEPHNNTLSQWSIWLKGGISF